MWQVVDGAGHFLQESHGEELAYNILDFLKSQSWRSTLFDANWNFDCLRQREAGKNTIFVEKYKRAYAYRFPR